MQQAYRRVRRAALIFTTLIALLIIYSLLVSPIGFFIWLVALPLAGMIACLTLLWPAGRRREAGSESDVTVVICHMEDWLLHRCSRLPEPALPAVDLILARLAEVQPNLASLPPNDPLAGEAERLIGRHLPNLVDSYLQLPASSREAGSQANILFTTSFETVAEGLMRLADEIGAARSNQFDTQRRFVDMRYRGDDALPKNSTD